MHKNLYSLEKFLRYLKSSVGKMEASTKKSNKNKITEEDLIEALKKIAPGTSIRTALDDIMRAEMGALILVSKEGVEAVCEGGFRLNCKFSPQKLVELAKMDGAIIISDDFKKIVSANTLLTPSMRYSSKETGTRHKAAERTAKQLKGITIAVSERKRKITVYYGDQRYELEKTSEVLRRATETLQILEKQKERFDDLMISLNLLEMNNATRMSDVCNVLQRIEIIKKISEMIKRDLIELGKDGIIVSMRVKELTKNILNDRELILRDYFPNTYEQTGLILEKMNFDFLIETSNITRLIFEETNDQPIASEGRRILMKTHLLEKERDLMMSYFETLDKLFNTNKDELLKIFKNENFVDSLLNELNTLREKILTGKLI